MWLNKESRIAEVANINQLHTEEEGSDEHLIFEVRAEYTPRQKKPVPSGARTCNFLICRPALQPAGH